MFIIGEIFNGLAFLVDGILTILMWLIIIRVVLSWFVDPYQNFMQMLIQATEPILSLFRKIPIQFGMLDFTPFIAIVALSVTKNILLRILIQLANQFGA